MSGRLIGEDEMLVPSSEYELLLESDRFLSALAAVGVDNWEGYETACQLYYGEITEDEI